MKLTPDIGIGLKFDVTYFLGKSIFSWSRAFRRIENIREESSNIKYFFALSFWSISKLRYNTCSDCTAITCHTL